MTEFSKCLCNAGYQVFNESKGNPQAAKENDLEPLVIELTQKLFPSRFAGDRGSHHVG